MNKVLTFLVLTFVFVCAPLSATAEEKFGDLLKRAQEFATSGKYPQAITELSWAMEQLQQKHTAKLKSFLPNEVSGLKAGEVTTNNALGMVNIERTYTTTEGGSMKVMMTGASAAKGAASSGLGAFAGMAQAAGMMGAGNPNAETVRIAGRRATISDRRGRKQLHLSLSTGMLLQMEQQGNKPVTKEKMLAVAEAIDYKSLDSYLATQ